MSIRHSLTWLATWSVLYGCVDIQKPGLAEVACLGHRGQATQARLENTLGSFLAAYNQGADGIELDVFHTRDNVAMVYHDKTLRGLTEPKPGQTCPADQAIGDFGFEQLRQRCQLANGEDIPTLESILQQFSSTDFRIFIEFKDPIQPRTLRLIDNHYPHPGARIQASSFLKDVIDKDASGSRPSFPLMLAHRRYVPGMELSFDGVDVGAIATTEIRRLHRAGKRIGVYGVNDAGDMRRALEERVHYITTDRLPLCMRLKQEALDEQR